MKADMPLLANVLVYDSDARGRETLVYGFEGEGVKAAAAATGEEVPALIAGARPQVLILTVREAGAEVELVRSLAEGEETRAIPRLVLAPSDTLPDELRTSGSFIALPAFVRDVLTASKLLAAGTTRAGADNQAEGQIELSGALSEYGLYFILRTMVGLGRSGIVQVERGNRKGELRFSEGDVVSAQVGSLQGHAALHQLLLWEEASLEVKFRPVVRLGQSLPGGEELLEDCERFLRDFTSATKNIGHAQSLFVQDADRVARLLDSIPAEVVPVMRLFDGQRSLGDVLEDSPFRVFDTLRTITRLLDMGIIRRKAIERPSTGFQSHLRRRNEEWIRPGAPAGAEVPAVPTPEPAAAEPAPAFPAEEPATERVGLFTRRRMPRRRTGEVPLPAGVNRAPAADAADQASVAVVAPPPPRVAGAPPAGTTMAVHGELRIPAGSMPATGTVPDVPKVVIDFSAADEDAAASEARLAPGPAPAAGGPPRAAARSAELETAGRGPLTPPARPPAEGPSIMVDPRLLAEMNALDEPPAPAPPPPAHPAPPAAPVAPTPPRPAAPSAVVSFVHGSAPARQPMPPVVPISAVPTVPVPTVPAGEAPGSRRASSEFDAVEKEFFEREADLYAPEAVEEGEGSDPTGGDPDARRPR
jgi:CheY-like chemotaxis protein